VPQQPAVQPGGQASAPAPAAAQASAPAAARAGGESALVRAMEMSLPAQAAPRRNRGGFVLESGDAAIPLDRVPYFTGDLKRLGITAALMIVLLVVAAVTVIPQVVK